MDNLASLVNENITTNASYTKAAIMFGLGALCMFITEDMTGRRRNAFGVIQYRGLLDLMYYTLYSLVFGLLTLALMFGAMVTFFNSLAHNS